MGNLSPSLGLSCLALAVTLSGDAFAYSLNTEFTDPCHETITLDALSRVRSEGLAPWLEPHGQDRALVDDLPINADTDLAGATLVLANRDVDLNGNAHDALDKLAPLHGSPGNQKKHCLRAPGDNEPDGSAKALAACQSVIHGQVAKALAGLAADGSVDRDHLTTFEAVLDIRGSVDAALPTFYVEMGRALHTFQDAFSHQWRTSDNLRVTTVLNYADVVNDDYAESRDGPPHATMLDECQELDSYRAARLEVARTASKELMVAALAPAADDTERMTRVDAVLAQYLQLEPGCTPGNHWCDAPETKYRDKTGCTCSATPAATPWGIAPFALGAALLYSRRRRSQRGVASPAGWAAFLGLALVTPRAVAQEEPAAQAAPPAETAPAVKEEPTPVAAEEAKPDAVCPTGATPIDLSPDSTSRVEPFPLGVYVAGGAAILTNPAVAASLGVRYRLSPHFLVGVDGELNPWFSQTTKTFRSGTTNVYGTLVVRFPMDFERFNVRSTLQLGISRMNFALYGVPKGTVGPYVGFNLVGLDFELSRSVYLVLDPAHIAIPIPQTSGVPFSYPQYRVTLGLQIGA